MRELGKRLARRLGRLSLPACVAVLGVVGVGGDAVGQISPEVKAALVANLSSADHVTRAKSIADGLERNVPGGCGEALITGPAEILAPFLEPPKVGADGKFVSGAWVERVRGSACGSPQTYRIIYQWRGGKEQSGGFSRGSTHADYRLFRDAKFFTINAAYSEAAMYHVCGDQDPTKVPALLFESSFTRLEGAPLTDGRQASVETWKVAICGRIINVILGFQPNEKGTAIVAHGELQPN